MTPAIRALQQAKARYKLHEYEHDPAAPSFSLECAAVLGVEPARVFKTLVAKVDGGNLVMGIVPASAHLDLKALAAAVGSKRAEMADPQAAQRATGYVLGGISPLGCRRKLATVLDRSAMEHATILVSAGRRGLQIEIAPGELLRLAGTTAAPIAAAGSNPP
jgi:Cys-tRNA(Pro)/Cys-tRNA(Cys) deacylase